MVDVVQRWLAAGPRALALSMGLLALAGAAGPAVADEGRWVCYLQGQRIEMDARRAQDLNKALVPGARRCHPASESQASSPPSPAAAPAARVAPATPAMPQGRRAPNQQFSCTGTTADGQQVDSAPFSAPSPADAAELFTRRFGRAPACCAHIDRPQECGGGAPQGLSLFACRYPKDPPLTLNWITVEAASVVEAQRRMGHRGDRWDPKACVEGPAERQIERIRRLGGGGG